MQLNVSSAKMRPFWLGLNVLMKNKHSCWEDPHENFLLSISRFVSIGGGGGGGGDESIWGLFSVDKYSLKSTVLFIQNTGLGSFLELCWLNEKTSYLGLKI